MSRIIFNNKSSIFYTELKSEVENYFNQKRIKKTANWKLFLKTGILVPSAILIYVFLLAFNWSIVGFVLMSALLGLVLSSIGFNIMHDACHGSYSSRKWANSVLG